MMRRAIVIGDRTDLQTVRDYLPRNYSALLDDDGTIVIVGEDDHGWTLDGYVLPRLGSGLIGAVECNSYKTEVRTIGDRTWSGNALRFKTAKGAEGYVHNLKMRWTAVTETRVEPSADYPGNSQAEDHWDRA